jgi:hypothetical protein
MKSPSSRHVSHGGVYSGSRRRGPAFLYTTPGNVVPVSALQKHVVPAGAAAANEQYPLSVTQNDDGVPRSGGSGA